MSTIDDIASILYSPLYQIPFSVLESIKITMAETASSSRSLITHSRLEQGKSHSNVPSLARFFSGALIIILVNRYSGFVITPAVRWHCAGIRTYTLIRCICGSSLASCTRMAINQSLVINEIARRWAIMPDDNDTRDKPRQQPVRASLRKIAAHTESHGNLCARTRVMSDELWRWYNICRWRSAYGTGFFNSRKNCIFRFFRLVEEVDFCGGDSCKNYVISDIY